MFANFVKFFRFRIAIGDWLETNVQNVVTVVNVGNGSFGGGGQSQMLRCVGR